MDKEEDMGVREKGANRTRLSQKNQRHKAPVERSRTPRTDACAGGVGGDLAIECVETGEPRVAHAMFIILLVLCSRKPSMPLYQLRSVGCLQPSLEKRSCTHLRRHITGNLKLRAAYGSSTTQVAPGSGDSCDNVATGAL